MFAVVSANTPPVNWRPWVTRTWRTTPKATVVLWRFRASAAAHGDAEKRAGRAAGILLFVLAAFVASLSVMSLLGHDTPQPTFLGIAILVAAATVMPWLTKEKRRLSVAASSAALRADAAQSALCAYLFIHRLGGTREQHDLAGKVGRPNCGFGDSAAHRLGGAGSLRGKACGCC